MMTSHQSRSYAIHLKAKALEMLIKIITEMHLKITLLKSKPHPPGANELNHFPATNTHIMFLGT